MVRRRLAAALEAAGLGPVTHLEHRVTGWETEIWECHADGERLAVRVFAVGRSPHVASREAAVMRALHQVGYPVPAIHHVEADPEVDHRPFLVMDFIDGSTLAGAGWSDRDVGRLTGQLMDRLHRLDPTALPGPRLDPAAEAVAALERLPDAPPGLGPVRDWIRSHATELGAPVPCHNDLHPFNILLDRDGRPWVVDWTAFAITDPAIDVAWTILLGEMYGSPEFTSGFLEVLTEDPPHPLAKVVAASRRICDLLFFVSAEGSGTVQPDAGIANHVPLLAVPAGWIERHTGLRIPEVDTLLGG